MQHISGLVQKKYVEFENARKANNRGDDWIENGFTQIPNKVITDSSLKNTPYRVLSVIYMHAFDKQSARLSQSTIAREAGLTGKHSRITVNRHFKLLEKKGYIRREGRRGDTCTYHILKKVRGP